MNQHDALPDSRYLVELENFRRKLLRRMLWSGLVFVVCVALAVWLAWESSGAGPTPGSASAMLRPVFDCLLPISLLAGFGIFAGFALTCGRVTTRIMAARSIRDTMAALTAQGLPPMTALLLAEKAWNQRMLRRTGAVMALCAAVVLGAFFSRGLLGGMPGWMLGSTLGLAGLCAPVLFLWSFIRFAIAGVRLLRARRPGATAEPPLASTSSSTV